MTVINLVIQFMTVEAFNKASLKFEKTAREILTQQKILNKALGLE